MSKYTLELSRSSKKFLDKSDRITKERIINVIHAITENLIIFIQDIDSRGDIYKTL